MQIYPCTHFVVVVVVVVVDDDDDVQGFCSGFLFRVVVVEMELTLPHPDGCV